MPEAEPVGPDENLLHFGIPRAGCQQDSARASLCLFKITGVTGSEVLYTTCSTWYKVIGWPTDSSFSRTTEYADNSGMITIFAAGFCFPSAYRTGLYHRNIRCTMLDVASSSPRRILCLLYRLAPTSAITRGWFHLFTSWPRTKQRKTITMTCTR